MHATLDIAFIYTIHFIFHFLIRLPYPVSHPCFYSPPRFSFTLGLSFILYFSYFTFLLLLYYLPYIFYPFPLYFYLSIYLFVSIILPNLLSTPFVNLLILYSSAQHAIHIFWITFRFLIHTFHLTFHFLPRLTFIPLALPRCFLPFYYKTRCIIHIFISFIKFPDFCLTLSYTSTIILPSILFIQRSISFPFICITIPIVSSILFI